MDNTLCLSNYPFNCAPIIAFFSYPNHNILYTLQGAAGARGGGVPIYVVSRGIQILIPQQGGEVILSITLIFSSIDNYLHIKIFRR